MEALVGAGKVGETPAEVTMPTVRTSPAVLVGTTSAAVTPVLAASPAASGSEEAGGVSKLSTATGPREEGNVADSPAASGSEEARGVDSSSPAVALDPLRDPSGEGFPAVHAAGSAVGRLPLPVLEGDTVDQAATRRSVTLVAEAAADHFRRHPEAEGSGGR